MSIASPICIAHTQQNATISLTTIVFIAVIDIGA